MPEDAVLQPEHALFWRAWHALRYDRHFGAMGGEGPIPFAAVDRYARRYGITGTAFDWLLTLISAMDAEYLPWAAERHKEALAQARQQADQHPPS